MPDRILAAIAAARPDQTDTPSDSPALSLGAGAARDTASTSRAADERQSIIGAVLAGATPRPGEDQPDYEIEMLPGAVDANLARANDHLDYGWKTGTRQNLKKQFRTSMRFARNLGELMFVLRSRDASLADKEEVVIDQHALTFYAGFLAGTDAAEASYLQRQGAELKTLAEADSDGNVNVRGACIDIASLDRLLEANDNTALNFLEVSLLARALRDSAEFTILSEVHRDTLIDKGWQAPEKDEAGLEAFKEDFAITAARLIRVGYMAARERMQFTPAEQDRVDELVDLFRRKVDMGSTHDEDLTSREYWSASDVSAARRIVRLERAPEEWAPFYTLIDQGVEENAAWAQVEQAAKGGAR